MEPEEQKTRHKRGHLLQSVGNQHQGLKPQEIKKMKSGEDWALESLTHGQNALLYDNMQLPVTTLKSEAKLRNDSAGLCQHSVEVDRGDKAREEASKILLQQGVADGEVEVSLAIPPCQTESLDRSVISQSQSTHRTAESLFQRNSKAILNHSKTKMKRGKEPEMLHLREKREELKTPGYSQNALSNYEYLQLTTTEIKKGLKLNNGEQRCKAVIELAYDFGVGGDTLTEIYRPGIRKTFNDGTMSLIGKFDPLLLCRELKDVCRVDLVTFSVLPLNTYAGLDGSRSYSTRKQFEKVLENLRAHNALLEYDIERVKCGIGSEQTVPHKSEKERSDISNLPRECIEHIISFTSPKDACSLSLVCRAFRDAAESNAVWERFIPSEGSDVISRSISFKPLVFPSAKHKYVYLCHNPVFLDDGSMCFTLEKRTGKRCFMIAPTMRSILNGYVDHCWEWNCLQEARFPRVPCLKYGPVLSFIRKFDTRLLSPKTTYVAYLVYKFADCSYGFETIPVELYIYFEGDLGKEKRLVLLDPPEDMPGGPREGRDGWKEMMMGEFFNGHGDHGSIFCCLERDPNTSGLGMDGIIINGIELRPKDFW